MKLEELLGEELYKQVQEKLDAANAKETDKLKHIRYVDLSEGEYVGKAKYDAFTTEKANLETQITTLNNTITDLKKNNKDADLQRNRFFLLVNTQDEGICWMQFWKMGSCILQKKQTQ